MSFNLAPLFPSGCLKPPPVLARESRMNAVHDSGVLGWIEQADIPFMHSQAGEPSVCCSFSEDLASISIPLNSSNWSVAKNEVCE
jgi:hypothetical protein